MLTPGSKLAITTGSVQGTIWSTLNQTQGTACKVNTLPTVLSLWKNTVIWGERLKDKSEAWDLYKCSFHPEDQPTRTFVASTADLGFKFFLLCLPSVYSFPSFHFIWFSLFLCSFNIWVSGCEFQSLNFSHISGIMWDAYVVHTSAPFPQRPWEDRGSNG